MSRILLVLTLLVTGACTRQEPPRTPGPMRIVVSIAPLTGLVSALAPPDASIRTLVPPGRSLHGYELSPADVAALGAADLVVYVGLGLDPAAEAFLRAHPSGRRRALSFAQAVDVRAEPHVHTDEPHEHHGPDPHLWLDPELVGRLIPALAGALDEVARAIAQPIEGLDSRALALMDRVAEVDAEYRTRLEPFRGASIVTHHNAYARVADRYGLKIAAVIRPIEGEEPTPGQIDAAVRAIRSRGARAVFVEPQFNPAAAERIAAAAGVPLGRLDPEGATDWFALMRANLDALVRILSPG